MSWKVYNKNNEELCDIHKLEYSGSFMGDRFITASITSPYPIDFSIGDYVIYRGEQFTLNYDPSIIKKATKNTTGDAFTYDNVKFNSYSDELVRCEFWTMFLTITSFISHLSRHSDFTHLPYTT